MPEPAGGGFEVSAETHNGRRRILAELSRPSEFRCPETETVSTETRSTGRLQRGQSKDLALTTPFGL